MKGKTMQATDLKMNKNPQVINESKLVLVWSITIFIIVMNTTMFNVALPNLIRDLSLTSNSVSWVVSGYSIVFAIATITYSRLSDFIPIKRLILVGLSLLAVASLIGFFSNHYIVLLLARIIQAAGAGAVPGLAMVLAGRYIPKARRGRAMSLISTAASLGFGLGPVIGGVVTQYLGWNYLFIITGLVVLLIPLLLKLLPEETKNEGHFDLLGAVFAAISVTLLLVFLSTLTIAIFFASVMFFIILWKHIGRINNPFINPNILKNRQYTKLVFIGFTSFTTHFAALFTMPLLLMEVYQREAAEIGLIIFPGAILSAIAARSIGRLIDHFGNKPIIIYGHLFLLISTLLFALLSTVSIYFVLVTYMFMSLGFSALTSSVSNEFTRILSKSELATGMGMAQLMQFFGSAFGVTLAAFLLTYQENLETELVFRNIFILLSSLIVFAIVTFMFYLREKNRLSSL
jgi:MFS transporter, DHA2 family, metal-tetracycline-proton antiporter